eukprot:4691031-Prymnesium_polylepis.1
MIKAEALALDTKWAMCVSDSDRLDAFIEANGEATEARAEAEQQRDVMESKACAMSICLDHDPKADRKGSASEKRDDHAW